MLAVGCLALSLITFFLFTFRPHTVEGRSKAGMSRHGIEGAMFSDRAGSGRNRPRRG